MLRCYCREWDWGKFWEGIIPRRPVTPQRSREKAPDTGRRNRYGFSRIEMHEGMTGGCERGITSETEVNKAINSCDYSWTHT